MIHTLNYTRTGLSAADNNTLVQELDLSQSLTRQLQKLVRQGNFFKVVGIDMSISPDLGIGEGTITGYLRYYAPTKGRCAAYRSAFKSAAEQMELQGIPMRDNKLYDFRAALSNNPQITALQALRNNSTLDGTNGLALKHATVPGASIFDVYNESIRPDNSGLNPADAFNTGFDTLLQSGVAKTDFVLNDEVFWSGNEDFANTSVEYIPFTIAYGPTATAIFQWRPDPALYQAVMCGLFEIFVEDCETTSPTGLEIKVAVMVSGWKSIMGDPDKKNKSRSRRKKTTHRNK